MAHPNAQIAQRIVDAATKKDVETMKSLMSPDVVVHISGNNHISGTHKGIQEFAAAFGSVEKATGGTITRELHDITASDDHAVVLLDVTGERAGTRYQYHTMLVYHIEDGKVTEQWVTTDDQAAMDGLFG